MKRTISSLVLAVLLLPNLAGLSAYSVGGAASYLREHAAGPWATIGLAALGQTNIPAEHLKTISASSAIGYAAPVLAVAALNKDPRAFGSSDYVATLLSYVNNGQIGDTTTLNDDFFGILALIAAGEDKTSPAVAEARQFIISHQNNGGGWGFTVTGASDTNMTSAAVLALLASGSTAADTAVTQALSWLKNSQNSDGGFPYDPASSYGTDSDTSSTAWVVWALNATGIPPQSWSKNNTDPIEYLLSRQQNGGYFEYQPGSPEDAFSPVTTAYAVIALSGKYLPLNIYHPDSGPESVHFRIEGSAATICAGTATAPTALDVVKAASEQCGYAYNIADTSFGPYVEQIGSDKATGLIGWLYRVNHIAPDVGAADYHLKGDEEILWYYGAYDNAETRLTISDSAAGSGDVVAIVEQYSNNAWLPLTEATVRAGTASEVTDATGKATFVLSDGSYNVYAEKPDFIRSNSVMLIIGQNTSSTVSLRVIIDAGLVAGETADTLAFTVEPAALDFGTLTPGGQASRNLALRNRGTLSAKITAEVTGNSLFTDNLLLANASWSQFQTNLAKDASQDVSVALSVPANYTVGGQKSGQIIFWAQRQ